MSTRAKCRPEMLPNVLKRGLNSLLVLVNARVVGRDWGPRGFPASFRAARAAGLLPNIVFDIGAARGEWSEATNLIFPGARYVMIDPLTENRGALELVAEQIRNAAVYTTALGAVSGRRVINTHGDQSSFLKSLDFDGDGVEVDVKTCDDIFSCETKRGESSRLLVKMDVQGFEIEVLKGAERALQNTDILLVEVSIQRIYDGNPLAHEVIAYLGERGFCIYDIASYVQRPYDRALTQVDLIFVRESSPLMSYVGWR